MFMMEMGSPSTFRPVLSPPGPIRIGPVHSSQPHQQNRHQPFDDLFKDTFNGIYEEHRSNSQSPPLLRRTRRDLIKRAHEIAESIYYPNDAILGPFERQQKALTKVFYHVLADEPWSEDWIRSPDVERKLSRYEFHPDSMELAQKYAFATPKDAVVAARRELGAVAQALADSKDNQTPVAKSPSTPATTLATNTKVPFDDIDIIYIPGTVSSEATNSINRNEIYPISVESIAYQLENHLCKEGPHKLRPWDLAHEMISGDDSKLLEYRKFACDVCDFAPHLLDNDNISLLVVLLILGRSEICKRFEENGIRIEGSTMSHRKSECMKHAMGWKSQEDKWGYDSFASELQKRIKNALNPSGRPRPRKSRKSSASITTIYSPIANGAASNLMDRPPAYGNTHANGISNGHGGNSGMDLSGYGNRSAGEPMQM